jgi:hypothetical protein
MEKTLVLAYPGSGKTFLADNYEKVSDFEFQHYRYDYGEYKHLPLEQLKGRTEIRTKNINWPKNFFNALDDELQKDRIVLVPFATSLLEVLDYLEKSNSVRIIFAIQDKDSFEKLAEIFRNRGNSEEFIERRRNDFQKCNDIISTSRFEKVYIGENEFLSDALAKIGIKFKKGHGVKNYI